MEQQSLGQSIRCVHPRSRAPRRALGWRQPAGRGVRGATQPVLRGATFALHSSACLRTGHCINAIGRRSAWVPHNPAFQRIVIGARRTVRQTLYAAQSFSWCLGTLLISIGAAACAQKMRKPEALGVEAVVQQLRHVPAAIPGMAPFDGRKLPPETLREEVYDRLLVLSPSSVLALAKVLHDPDAEFRRNVALALMVLSGGWWRFGGKTHKVDITAVLPDLIAALTDTDSTVRAWAAQDIGNIDAGAATAVPALRALLASNDEVSRNSACIALGGLGPSAAPALPSLRSALSNSSKHARRFADIAIERIAR